MQKLTDMRRSKTERETSSPVMSSASGDAYDYGLRIRLDDASIKKLHLSLPRVGASMSISAKGVVVSVSSNRSERKTDRSVEIQIQKLSVEEGAASMEDAVSEGIEEADEK